MVTNLNKDKILGLLLLVSSPVFLLFYGWLLFFSPFEIFIIELTVFLIISLFFIVFVWVGYTIIKISFTKNRKNQIENSEASIKST
jgi:hypothetical protein